MTKENFILVSLDDPKTKKLAQTISNESCKKILNYLADKEATESELSEKLDIPISTVHYNLQQLTKANLVTAEEFHYSKKGKEVNHYKLANKYVIIAPKSVWGLKEKLKSILPVALLVGGIGAIIRYLSTLTFQATEGLPPPMAAEVPTTLARSAMLAEEAAPKMMMDTALGASPEAINATTQVINQTINQSIWPSASLWFILGAMSALVLYLIIDYILNRLRKR